MKKNKVSALKKKWFKNPKFKAEYIRLEPKYKKVRKMIKKNRLDRLIKRFVFCVDLIALIFFLVCIYFIIYYPKS